MIDTIITFALGAWFDSLITIFALAFLRGNNETMSTE